MSVAAAGEPMETGDALLRLMQIASPSFPVGAYSYSQALEWAVHEGSIGDEASALNWIKDQLLLLVARFEAPLFLRLHAAWVASDFAALCAWNTLFIASRETSELRDETLQMGTSMRRTLLGAALVDAQQSALLNQLEPLSYPSAFACASAAQTPRSALSAYLWAWCENQVLNAVKTVPLGQLAGQRMLRALAHDITDVVSTAAHVVDAELSNFCAGLAIASCRHETQYSRLYRS